jgi:hypothetical protein
LLSECSPFQVLVFIKTPSPASPKHRHLCLNRVQEISCGLAASPHGRGCALQRVLAILSNGCASVRLGNLTNYSEVPESVYLARDLRSKTSERHVLTEGDSVELTAGGALLDVEVGFARGLPNTLTLMQKVPRAALPISLLTAADRIKITYGETTTELRPSSAAKPDIRGMA